MQASMTPNSWTTQPSKETPKQGMPVLNKCADQVCFGDRSSFVCGDDRRYSGNLYDTSEERSE
jgi:hypothetical protein